METDYINGLFIPIILVFCLCLGYIMKHWIRDVDNKYIPTLLAILGAAAACLINYNVSFELITRGMLTGLASTGLHQMFKQYIEKE